jgi:uncharacterized protein YecT (DUF1311 family)
MHMKKTNTLKNHITLIVALASAVFVFPAPADEETKKAEDPLTMQEARARFTAADDNLNAIWQDIKKECPPKEWKRELEEQREWFHVRDYRATGYLEQWDREDPAFWDRATSITDERIARLKGTLANFRDEAPTMAQAMAKFAAAERKLNTVWPRLKAEAREDARDILLESQRRWIDYREFRAGGYLKENKKDDPRFWSYAASITDGRTALLRGWMEYLKAPYEESWTGLYCDSLGEDEIQMVHIGNKVWFTISIRQGPTYHIGKIWDTAEVNVNMARYTDNNSDSPAWLTFIRHADRAERMQVIETNAHGHRGVRCRFNGHYIRVRGLSKLEQDAVIAEIKEVREMKY